MKRFTFPLERVERWRLEQLNLEELKLRQILAERQTLARAKEQIRHELERVGHEVLFRATLEPEDLENLDSFRQHIHARIRGIENRERETEAQIIAQRERVIEARRQFELLNRLRQKALAEWRVAADKEQETLAAEMFLAKTIRNA
jgi:hypothetical protein